MLMSRQITLYRAVLNAAMANEFEETCALEGFTDYALAGCDPEHQELSLYAGQEGLPEKIQEMCEWMMIQPQMTADENDLIRPYLPDTPVHLCKGHRVVLRYETAEPGDILIRPSAAFGDGHHPSTRIAAELLAGLNLNRRRVLDLGTGSGVLAILAERLGARSVLASDDDPKAITVANAAFLENSCRHCIAKQSHLFRSLCDEAPFDILIANLYADLIQEILLDPLLDRLLPTGHLVWSGVATKHSESLHRAVRAAGFTIKATREEAWWNAGIAYRSKNQSDRLVTS